MDGDNKIVQTEQWKDKTAIYTREVSGDKLTVVRKIGNSIQPSLIFLH